MQAEVLVLDHDPTGLDRLRDIDRLGEIERRRIERMAQFVFRRVSDKRDAVDRANVYASVALDAQGGGEYGLDVAVKAAFRFADGLHEIESELDFSRDVFQRHRVLDVRHLKPAIEGYVIVVGPLVNAHL